MNKIKYTMILIIIIITLCFNNYVFADYEDEDLNLEEVEEVILESSTIPTEEPKINARSAIIYDRESNEIIWGKNEHDKRAMASTTKIMTAIVVLENSNLSDIVTISKKAAGTGGSRLKINTTDKITVNDLLYGLMLRSGNDCAVALAEHVGGSIEEFANLMNNKAKSLGLLNTNFVTPHGLDDENHYTTAYELAVLTNYALNNETFAKIVNTKSISISINGKPRVIGNTNELLGSLQGVDGVKTGFTGNAGRCLVTSCSRQGGQIITIVLGCDTKKQRTSDSIKLIEYAFKNYSRINLKEKIEKEFENWKHINSNRIYINKAEKQQIELKLENINKEKIPIKIGEEKDIKIEINAIYQYEAPVQKGTKIGNIVVKKKDEIIETIDIISVNTIEKKHISHYFKELLGTIVNLDFYTFFVSHH